MNKGLLYTLVIIVFVVAMFFGIKYGYAAYNSNVASTPFEYIKFKGATKTTSATAGDRYDFGDYGFYSNNRVAQFSTQKKGTYDKVKIIWDDKTETTLISIFGS